MVPLPEKMGYNTGLANESGKIKLVNSFDPTNTLIVVLSFSFTNFTVSFFWA
jgi:hypothetical protein